MDQKELKPGRTFTTISRIKVCFYDNDDCLMPNGIHLSKDTDLTYVGPDAENGHVFLTDDAEKVCLHDDDLLYINFAKSSAA